MILISGNECTYIQQYKDYVMVLKNYDLQNFKMFRII